MSQLPETFAGSRKARLFRLVAIGLAQAAFAVAVAILSSRLFELALADAAQTSPGGLAVCTSALMISIAAVSVLQRFEIVEAEKLGQDYVADVRTRAHDHLCRLSLGAGHGLRHGALMLRFVNDLTSVRQWISLGISQLIVSSLLIVGSIAGLFWLSPLIGAVVTVVIVAGAAAIVAHGWRLDDVIRKARRQRGRLAGALDAKLRMLSTTNAFARRSVEQRQVKRLSRRLYRAMTKRAALRGDIKGIVQFTTGAASAAAIAAGAIGQKYGWAEPADIIAAIAVLGILSTRFASSGRIFEYWRSARIGRAKISRVFSSGPLVLQPADRLAFDSATPSIEFAGASLKNAVQDISGAIPFGERVLLAGASGSGKSTILNLVMRLVDVDRGSICVGGTDIRNIGLGALRRTVSIVADAIPLTRGSVDENVRFGRELSAARIIGACALCGISTQSRSDQLNVSTKIDDFGANLSRSDWFRVALARALAGAPRILLLDEADAHLDAAAHAVLVNALATFKGTVIFVSHRPEMFNMATVIWRVGAGRLLRCERGALARAEMPALKGSVGEAS